MYEVRFTEAAERELDRLDPQGRRRILKRLFWLAQHADEFPHEALKGPLAPLFKLRIGDYRVLYDLVRADRVLLVHVIGHRREVYD